MEKLTFINDRYRNNRGGWSRFLSVSCKTCNGFLFFYQKDGPGPLKRSYIDRIIDFRPSLVKGNFSCPSCGVRLGIDEPYKKENNRQAIRWLAEAVAYKIIRK